MRVLLRQFGDKYYVWKDAKWENDHYYLIDDNDDGFDDLLEIEQDEIIAIEDDPRIGYVKCRYCGELIENNLESIEAHYVSKEKEKNCSMCEHMRAGRDKRLINSVMEKNFDGTYSVTQTFVANLLCSKGYWSYQIDSEDADRNCVYKQCRLNGVESIDDVFVKYPGLFESFITVDTLVKHKCEKEEYRCGFFEYDLKCRGTLKACVNKLGIVDHFRMYYRGHSFKLYYSDKYNLLLRTAYGSYYLDLSNSSIPDKKFEEVKHKIAALYKEANK